MSMLEMLVIAPPQSIKPKSTISSKSNGAKKRGIGLAEELKEIARGNSVYFFDSNSVTEASVVIGIRLDENQRQILDEAIANEVLNITTF